MKLDEIWKEIEGTNGVYLVSNLGRVKSVNYRGQKGVEKIMIGGRDEKGYRVVTIAMFKGKKTQKVHRLVAKAFVPNPNGFEEVNHIDGDKENNNAETLNGQTEREIWGTPAGLVPLTMQRAVWVNGLMLNGKFPLLQLMSELGRNRAFNQSPMPQEPLEYMGRKSPPV